MGEILANPDIDAMSRKRIVTEIDKNFFVEAGAGSGKTTMLVRRMAAMVEAGVDISRICAITFTKAAAGEFYDRFQKLLIDRSNPPVSDSEGAKAGMLPEPTDETRERCRNALQNIDLCFMGTIDSFCGMILSEHPSEAGIPSDSSIVSDEEAEAFYKQLYVKICGGEYGSRLQEEAEAFQALHREAQEIFVKGISFVMNNRNAHFNYHAASAVDIDKDFAQERKELTAAVKCLMDHPELKYDGNKESREAWTKIGDIYRNIRGRWSVKYTTLLYGIKELVQIRLIPEALNHYAQSLGTFFELGGKKGKWLECTLGRERGLLEKLQKLQYDASMTFLMECVPLVEQAFREKGKLTFFDYLYNLRNILKKDAEGDGKLIRYLYDRHSYFLIDEFQDTNPMQAEVFFYLSAEKPVPQWRDCIPRPGSLFIVGDPKQSIYRFRSADVNSFLKVRKLFEKNGGEILTLTRNFRSTRKLCEYFNRVFGSLLPEDTENQSRFEEIPLPDPAENGFEGIYTYKAYFGKGTEDNPSMTDPVRIADMIERLTGNRTLLIRGEQDTQPRPVRFSDIMVISYSKRNLGPILAELKERDIPARVEGDVPFVGNQALSELCLIYSAVADAEDTFALYGALTGGQAGLTKEDLVQYKSCGGAISLKADFDKENCKNAGALCTADKIEKLKQLYFLSKSLSPAALFSKIMDTFRIYQTIPADNLEVVYYALELLRDAEKSGKVISLKDGAAFLRGLLAGECEQERCLSLDADRDCVHMANLHKVKGLEAPIVILSSASIKNSSAAYRLEHDDAGSEGWLFTLEGERNENGLAKVYFASSDYPDQKQEEVEALKAEGRRLIYVAATRARNALILCRSYRISRGKETANSMWEPLMESGLPDIFVSVGVRAETERGAGICVDAESLYTRAESDSALNDRSAESATFKTGSPSHLAVGSKIIELPETAVGDESGKISQDEKEKNLNTGKRVPSALLGTMVHRLMEMLVTTGNKVDAEEAVGEIIREYLTPGMESFKNQLHDMLIGVIERIRKGGYAQENGLPQDILSTLLSAEKVHCEMPFCYRDAAGDRKVWNGIMDVVYREAGKWHIVDYKTNADGNDLDEKYKGQLDAYVSAFKAITGSDADAATYHIDI